MPVNFPYFLSSVVEEVQDLRRNWGWFVALGVVLIAVGALAISYPVTATITTVQVFGILALIAGVVEIVSGVWTRRWGGFFLHLLCGLLYLFLGVVLLDRPLLGAAGYTLLLAVFFVASGLFRTVVAATQRFSGWGWVLLSGVITFILGVMIWQNLPEAALWVIGLFVGIDLIFNGWSWVMLGLAVRHLPSPGTSAEGTRGQLAGV
ncbi:MAG TPA: HdeD family acid-resistance protein [Gemmataceae bacterium]|nr:HdeD family acid-resistance protein [Gemmataceae bacterium]